MPNPLRTATGQNQRTLKPEGPLSDEGAIRLPIQVAVHC